MAIFSECEIAGRDFILDFLRCTLQTTDTGQGSVGGILALFAGIIAIFGIGAANYGGARAAPPALFVGTIAAFIMAKLEFVPDKTPFVCIILFVVSLFFLEKETGEQ